MSNCACGGRYKLFRSEQTGELISIHEIKDVNGNILPDANVITPAGGADSDGNDFTALIAIVATCRDEDIEPISCEICITNPDGDGDSGVYLKQERIVSKTVGLYIANYNSDGSLDNETATRPVYDLGACRVSTYCEGVC